MHVTFPEEATHAQRERFSNHLQGILRPLKPADRARILRSLDILVRTLEPWEDLLSTFTSAPPDSVLSALHRAHAGGLLRLREDPVHASRFPEQTAEPVTIRAAMHPSLAETVKNLAADMEGVYGPSADAPWLAGLLISAAFGLLTETCRQNKRLLSVEEIAEVLARFSRLRWGGLPDIEDPSQQ